jgi:hypothetical protein
VAVCVCVCVLGAGDMELQACRCVRICVCMQLPYSLCFPDVRAHTRSFLLNAHLHPHLHPHTHKHEHKQTRVYLSAPQLASAVLEGRFKEAKWTQTVAMALLHLLLREQERVQ